MRLFVSIGRTYYSLAAIKAPATTVSSCPRRNPSQGWVIVTPPLLTISGDVRITIGSVYSL